MLGSVFAVCEQVRVGASGICCWLADGFFGGTVFAKDSAVATVGFWKRAAVHSIHLCGERCDHLQFVWFLSRCDNVFLPYGTIGSGVRSYSCTECQQEKRERMGSLTEDWREEENRSSTCLAQISTDCLRFFSIISLDLTITSIRS